jgi:lipopolysaccharide/colanic/teichoic acid biosynthesis glycosyltransferase
MSQIEKRIALISTDNQTISKINQLLDDQFTIDIYPNGMALHYALQKHVRYYVIMSDDEFNGINGISLCKTIEKLGKQHIPFVLFVNKMDSDQKQKALEAGIADFLLKPLNDKAIQLRIPFIANNYNAANTNNTKAKEFKLPLIKRIFDVTFSGTALLLLSPLFLIVYLLIKLESKGPAFYYSLRVGSSYKVFKFYKFRSMFTGADAKLKDLGHLNQYNVDKAAGSVKKESSAVKELCDLCEQAGTGCSYPLYADGKILCEKIHMQQKAQSTDSAFIKIKNDPRITKIGNFIRNTSIDELPQLWNVFIGDMSIVGNRPLPLYEAEKITTDRYAQRFMAPAGITGLWQVEKRGKGEMSEDERLQLDNKYASLHSFIFDIKLILRTVPALFQTENV